VTARKGRARAEARAKAEADARSKARAKAEAANDEPEDEDAPEPAWGNRAWLALVTISVVMLGVRLYAASVVGFGDSEALYATWAAYPQPAYLDHPGMIGVVARAIGEGAIPTALRVHAVTSILATLVPWLVFATARSLGAARGGAALAAIVVAVVPETAIGLFALTPDLLLAPAWVGALALVGIGLRGPAGSNRSAAAFIAAGLLAGIACAAKVSGLLLVAALGATYLTVARAKVPDGDTARAWTRARAAVRTLWPWAGIVAGLVTLIPIVFYEAKTGWPMLRHRFVDTQTGAGVALKNVAALVGGQLLYLSPVFALLAVLAARDLFRRRKHDPISRLLFFAFAVPLLPLVVLCVWSPVAEPHWIAPALLVLPIHAARRLGEAAVASRRGFVVAASIAAGLTVAVHAWVLVPALGRLLPANTDPKLDISNELYGWPTAIQSIKEQMASAGTPFDPEGREVVVVGAHWTICAQLSAGLPGVRVGCATPVRDDFDAWLPREQWRRAEHVLFVTDSRFPGDGAEQLPALVRTSQSRVRVLRGGRTARVFELFLYDRRAQGSL
jgi:hypothetical protein